MKTFLLKFTFLVIASIFFSVFLANTALGQTITINNTAPTTFCASTSTPVAINFDESGFNDNLFGTRIFTARLYNSSGTQIETIGNTSFNTNFSSSGTITGSINQSNAGIYTIRVTSGSIASNPFCIVVFPRAPILTTPANTCASAFTLPAVTPVPGFNVQYSIDAGAFSAAPSTITPGCHTVRARYVFASSCGNIPAGTPGPGACSTSNPVIVIIFPNAPPAPTVSSGCGPFTVAPPQPVAGFIVQYSFNDGATWGGNNPPTASNCAGYRIRTRYVLVANCGPTPAGTAAACATSPATTRIVDTQDPTVTTAEGADRNLGCNPTANQISAAFSAPTFADNCGAPTVTVTNTHSGSGCQQSDTRTWTATDACGNTTTASQTITYTVDNQDPTLATAEGEDTNLGCNPTQQEINAAFEAPVFADNCGTPTVSFADQTSNQGCTRTVTRTWTAEDACGNTATTSQSVTYTLDTEDPIPNCPSNISVAPTTLSGTVVNYTTPTATDNCGSPSRVQTAGRPSGSTFPIGTTTNTFEFTDACGNKSTCSFTVTVTNPYCDNNPKNKKVYVCHNGNTICISVNALKEHLDHGDYLGACTTRSNTPQASRKGNNQVLANAEVESFEIVFSPNPTTTSFSLKVESNSDEPINIRVMDATGKKITNLTGVKKGSSVSFGANYRGGIYFAEVIQGAKLKTVKLIKQN